MEENNQNNLLDNTQGPNVTIGNFDGTINTNQETQPVSDENNIQEPKKKNKTLLIVLIIVLVALVGIGGYFAYDKFFAHKEETEFEEKQKEQQEANKEEDPIEEKNDEDEDKSSSASGSSTGGKLDYEKVKNNPTAICVVEGEKIYGSRKVSINECNVDSEYISSSIFYLEDGKVYFSKLVNKINNDKFAAENDVYQIGKNIKDKITDFLVWSPYPSMENYSQYFFVVMKTDKNEVYYYEEGEKEAVKIKNSENTIKIESIEDTACGTHFKFTKKDNKSYYYNRGFGSGSAKDIIKLDVTHTYEESVTYVCVNIFVNDELASLTIGSDKKAYITDWDTGKESSLSNSTMLFYCEDVYNSYLMDSNYYLYYLGKDGKLVKYNNLKVKSIKNEVYLGPVDEDDEASRKERYDRLILTFEDNKEVVLNRVFEFWLDESVK